MSNIDRLESPAADLVTATAMLADLVCSLGTSNRLCEETHAQALWIANRVRDDMKALFESTIEEIEAAAQRRLGR